MPRSSSTKSGIEAVNWDKKARLSYQPHDILKAEEVGSVNGSDRQSIKSNDSYIPEPLPTNQSLPSVEIDENSVEEILKVLKESLSTILGSESTKTTTATENLETSSTASLHDIIEPKLRKDLEDFVNKSTIVRKKKQQTKTLLKTNSFRPNTCSHQLIEEIFEG